jgi:hypothetical protein
MRVAVELVSSGGIPALTGSLENTLRKTTNGSRRRHEFGIFYELQLPRPWEAGGELKLYQDALTQLETADALPYHVLVVEHHFPEEYSHSPSPDRFSRPPASATVKPLARPRHFSAHHQSSRTRRRACRGARSPQQRTLRIAMG